ncbi:MAG TPA: FecR domain-containing protein, partial [Steroidobacteraceae bacterium]
VAEGALLADQAPRVTDSRDGRPRASSLRLAAGVLLAVAAGVTISMGLVGRGSSFSTSVGGLSIIPTQDGSVVTLNTDSKIEVRFTAQERRIELDKGEAFFEVAKDPSKPFVVYAGKQRVVAVGTKFSVRLNSDTVHVAVTEGKVRLESRPSILDDRAGASDGLTAGTVADVKNSRISVEQRPIPEIEQALSWRAGYIGLNGTPLADAIAEFNRYNTRQLLIGDLSLATLKVEGNFRSNNLDGFIRLLEQGFEVKTEESEDGRIVLKRN